LFREKGRSCHFVKKIRQLIAFFTGFALVAPVRQALSPALARIRFSAPEAPSSFSSYI
jgi:cytochrome b subunit of formate dehydrogenase